MDGAPGYCPCCRGRSMASNYLVDISRLLRTDTCATLELFQKDNRVGVRMVSIRSAEMRDAAAIAHVHVQSWLTTYQGIVPKEYLAFLNEAERVPLWQEWLTRGIGVFVAEIEGEVVGFAAGGALREPLHAYDSELYALYLLKEVQGRGIGRALLGAVITALVQKGYKSMLVWVLEQNPAVRFYERAGAQYITSKQIEIGSVQLPEAALGWPDLVTASGS
jgi:GNAT superfamily N-acetyltransferase